MYGCGCGGGYGAPEASGGLSDSAMLVIGGLALAAIFVVTRDNSHLRANPKKRRRARK